MVGAAGFEPTTTRPPDVCATRLRYAPITSMCISLFVRNCNNFYNNSSLKHLPNAEKSLIVAAYVSKGKITMTLQNTRKSNYPEWYQNVITAADMAELSASPGCMVIRPWGYGLWEQIQKVLDAKIKATGCDNCYFPLLIPLSFFEKEADHVDGFAKEMAVVTHSRLTQKEGKLVPDGALEEPLIIRPTSEAIIADSFAKWVKSYRDLPIMVNQWANVVRWEMRPRLFLRTREFLWQEGHTAFAHPDEAEANAMQILEIYRQLVEDYLAIPAILGKKPEHEKFPGAVATYTFETMMQDGRALQSGTTHNLGQTFSKANDIKFLNKNNTWEFAYTASWGVSSRLIGALIMSHADDEGMVVPPRVAPSQVVIVPMIKSDEDRDIVMPYVNKLASELGTQMAFGEPLRVKVDTRDKSSVDKYWEWARKGAPILCEIGKRDVDGNNVMVKTRLALGTPDGKKIMSKDTFVQTVGALLSDVQAKMFAAAKHRMDTNVRTDITTPEAFEAYFAGQNQFLAGDSKDVAFVRGKWCGDEDTLAKMKEMRISIRCLPFNQSGTEGVCVLTGRPATIDAIFARAY